MRTTGGRTGLGINGLGRIGRAVLRQEHGSVRAVNDVIDDRDNLRYLLRFDSVYGRWEHDPRPCPQGWTIDGAQVAVSPFSRIDDVDWAGAGVGVVLDCSGSSAERAQYERILDTGVAAVVVTHLTDNADHTVAFGANEDTIDPARHRVVSAGTCDGTALAPVLHLVDGLAGIAGGSVTTLHPALAYQGVLDGPVPAGLPKEHAGAFGLGRATGSNVIPKETSAVRAAEAVLPRIAGRVRSMSYRVPTPAVSSAALWLRLERAMDADTLRRELDDRAGGGVLAVSDEELVSTDVVGTPHAATVDWRFTEVHDDGRLLRLVLWYDNEWGYAAHVLRLAAALSRA